MVCNATFNNTHTHYNVKLFFTKDITDVVMMYLEATKDLMNWKTQSNKISRTTNISFYMKSSSTKKYIEKLWWFVYDKNDMC
jgi:hypothetical protein